MGEIFWQTLYATAAGTVAGGIIATYIAFLLSKDMAASNATYAVIHKIISDEFVDRRQELVDAYILYDPLKIASATKNNKVLFKLQRKIVNHLNYYDALMISVDNSSLKHEVIRSSVLPIIKRDHEIYEAFLVHYSQANDLGRPMLPKLRKYRHMWG